ncbi:CRE-TTR-9 protein [Caenorhabditis remanei]|uniref:CRE-TTR-9 protein n=1 Tax=Caenorhabditis remanei TaxID=31234 RepID=E3ND84_CAERE|nr:CRE-TTR-9 protein [Caenorhabditis remanei]
MHKPTLIISLLFFIFPSVSIAGNAAVHVRGRLVCNGKPFKNEKVELYDKNKVKRDTRILTTKTDELGNFVIQASINEWTFFTPNPYIYFPNYCVLTTKIGSFECANGIKIFVPEAFVHEGHLPKSTFDIGEVELSGVKTEQQGLERLVYSIFDQQECRDV